MDNRFAARDTVVNRIRETPGEKPIMAELNTVNPGVENQRIDLRNRLSKK